MDVFLAARRGLPGAPGEQIALGPQHARHSPCLIEFLFTERPAEIEVLKAARGDPDVPFGVVDQHAGVGEKTQKDPDLYGDEDDRKLNSRKRHQKTDAVVEEVLTRDGNHRPITPKCSY